MVYGKCVYILMVNVYSSHPKSKILTCKRRISLLCFLEIHYQDFLLHLLVIHLWPLLLYGNLSPCEVANLQISYPFSRIWEGVGGSSSILSGEGSLTQGGLIISFNPLEGIIPWGGASFWGLRGGFFCP